MLPNAYFAEIWHILELFVELLKTLLHIAQKTFEKCTQNGSVSVHTFSPARLLIYCAFLKSKQTTNNTTNLGR